jgi:hypothetical protein
MVGEKFNLIFILLLSFNKIQILKGRNLSLKKYWTSHD